MRPNQQADGVAGSLRLPTIKPWSPTEFRDAFILGRESLLDPAIEADSETTKDA
jgi:hypothetical protein